MKHYTGTIPYELAEKLKEKGMPILIEQEWYPNGMPKAEKDCHKPMTKYCEVFDWLLEQGVNMDLSTRSFFIVWDKNGDPLAIKGKTWHEAANKAIEKALTLI